MLLGIGRGIIRSFSHTFPAAIPYPAPLGSEFVSQAVNLLDALRFFWRGVVVSVGHKFFIPKRADRK